MDPNDSIPGRVVSWGDDATISNLRGLLVMRPGLNRGALDVHVLTDLGTEVIRLEVTAAEIIYVEVPFDALPAEYKAKAAKLGSAGPGTLAVLPGKMAFKRADGVELVFLSDSNAGVYAIPQAVERPRK